MVVILRGLNITRLEDGKIWSDRTFGQREVFQLWEMELNVKLTRRGAELQVVKARKA
jgi:hypothetical protein